jgi:hypothetical protein
VLYTEASHSYTEKYRSNTVISKPQFINRGTLKRDWETEVIERESGFCIDSMQSAQSPAGFLLRFLILYVAAKMALAVST